MSAKKPRAAYCTGCGVTFLKMHLMMQHRRKEHCGGRFLPTEERYKLDELRLEREAIDRELRPAKAVRSDLPYWEA